MDSGVALKKQNPRQSASLLSKLFYFWMIRLCQKGCKKTLNFLDLYKTLPWNCSEKLTSNLEKNWKEQILFSKLKPQPPSLSKALFHTFFWEHFKLGVASTTKFIFLTILQPIILEKFINSFSNFQNLSDCIYFGCILIGSCFLMSFFNHHIEYGLVSCGMRARIAASSLIYRKLLEIDRKELEHYPAGHIINLLSNDVNRFEPCALFLNFLWILPIQMVLLTWYVWTKVNVAVCVGLGFCAILMFFMTAFLPSISSFLRSKSVEKSDKRVKLMNEIISGIEIIKMYAWEKPFEQVIKKTRSKEIKYISKSLMLKGGYLSAAFLLQKIAVFLTIITHIYLGNKLTASVVFPLYQSFNTFQSSIAFYLPCAILTLSDALISIKRIQEFLLLPTKSTTLHSNNAKNKEIIMKNIAASWSNSSNFFLNFNLVIPTGCLCAIVGPVGSGKSSILNLVLRELTPNSGSVSLSGSVSYSSQEPWLFNSTVRNNILFGEEFNQITYNEIVRVCALEKDFYQLPNGDESLVSDRGVSLSGGQKSRINLARAIYKNSDIYLLDDPLSAVDARVSKHLFEECVLGYLKDKTRILVTHQLQYLKKADLIVVVNEGRIEAQGSFQELSKSNLEFTKLLVNSIQAEAGRGVIKRRPSLQKTESVKCMKIEEKFTEKSFFPLKDYLKTGVKNWTIIWLFLLGLSAQIFWSLIDIWISFWTQHQENTSNLEIQSQIESPLILKIISKSSKGILKRKFFTYMIDEKTKLENIDEIQNIIQKNQAIYIYAALLTATIILIPARNLIFFKTAIKTSKRIHNCMLHSLLKAPKRFFDINSSGKILNRFSKDVSGIDEIIPTELVISCTVFYTLLGISVILIFTNIYVTFPLGLVALLFLQIGKWYTSIARSLKHLESTTKSPIFSQVTASINGLTTIRASSKEKKLRGEFDNLQDTHTSAYQLLLATKACFGLWLDLVSSCFVSIVIVSFILLKKYSVVDDSLIGLAVTQAIVLTTALQIGIKQISDFINDLVIVERVIEYKNIKSEENHGNYINPNWPNKGNVCFKNVFLRYSKLSNNVLKDLNFSVESGEKIGIVGRTGAGKSSILNALFRLVSFEGTVEIDGIDTKTIQLCDLRKKISIIPQNPVLFSATLRHNLDPFAEFSDEKLWRVLEQVQIKKSISSLDVIVSEGGGNFSIGQKQLLCLARAILRNNKILVLDEATASVDPKTDCLIQETLKKQFRECTVFTIAHRLNTVMDSDKILVMENGRIVEFDRPDLLLRNCKGYFYRLAEQVGVLKK